MNETREEIVAKIDVKRGSVEKLSTKQNALVDQKALYTQSIADHEAKIEKLRKLISKIDSNSAGHGETEALRASEVDHMEEILDRFDKATAERSKVVGKIQERIEAVPNWMPGMDNSLKGAIKTDAQYIKLNARRDYLDAVIESALPDIKKIFYSRGTVSGANEKGRKGV